MLGRTAEPVGPHGVGGPAGAVGSWKTLLHLFRWMGRACFVSNLRDVLDLPFSGGIPAVSQNLLGVGRGVCLGQALQWRGQRRACCKGCLPGELTSYLPHVRLLLFPHVAPSSVAPSSVAVPRGRETLESCSHCRRSGQRHFGEGQVRTRKPPAEMRGAPARPASPGRPSDPGRLPLLPAGHPGR